VATGEHCHNRVIFKQLLQAEAIDFCRIDSARLGDLNEVMIVLLMAAKFGVSVCPHAGGSGLCEYADHLHEQFVDTVVTSNGHYMSPQKPG
jgi:L-fuconate dehydratase